MKLIEGMDADLAEGDTAGLALLREINEYRIPGYVRPAGDPLDPYGDVSYRLLELGLITVGPEPMGTYGPDGREEYGSVYRLTENGIMELTVWE